MAHLTGCHPKCWDIVVLANSNLPISLAVGEDSVTSHTNRIVQSPRQSLAECCFAVPVRKAASSTNPQTLRPWMEDRAGLHSRAASEMRDDACRSRGSALVTMVEPANLRNWE